MSALNPYIDPDTGTHYNKLGITDREQLKQAEYAITRQRIAELKETPITGKYDLDHLQRVHHHIFQDVYPWAGQVRTLNFSKRDPIDPDTWTTPFAPVNRLKELSGYISDTIQAMDGLRGLERPEFAKRLAEVYTALNHLHPMPEGNGRMTQTLLSQLATEAGQKLDFKRVGSVEWNEAAARTMTQRNRHNPAVTRPGDQRRIEAVFARITVAQTPPLAIVPTQAVLKQRLLVMGGERILQNENEPGKWQPYDISAAQGIKAGIYNLFSAGAADKGKAYNGPVLHIDPHSVFQHDGGRCIRHERSAFQTLPEIGESKRISYDNGRAVVMPPPLTQARSFSR